MDGKKFRSHVPPQERAIPDAYRQTPEAIVGRTEQVRAAFRVLENGLAGLRADNIGAVLKAEEIDPREPWRDNLCLLTSSEFLQTKKEGRGISEEAPTFQEAFRQITATIESVIRMHLEGKFPEKDILDIKVAQFVQAVLADAVIRYSQGGDLNMASRKIPQENNFQCVAQEVVNRFQWVLKNLGVFFRQYQDYLGDVLEIPKKSVPAGYFRLSDSKGTALKTKKVLSIRI